MLLGTQKINSKGHLEIGGCDTIDLAAQFGTPLYVMDEELIRNNCSSYKQSFEKEYGNVAVVYASKSFTVAAMCALVAEEGLWLDVASAGELYTAKLADFPMGKIVFHGNYKSVEELEMAVEYGVGCVVGDSFSELEILSDIAKEAGITQKIMLRCNPGVDPHTHRLISTGQEDSKFGFNIKDGTAMRAVKKAISLDNLNLIGLHCHLGSQLLDMAPFTEAAPVMAGFFKKVKDETDLTLEIMSLGGGLGVRYLESHNPPSIADFAKIVSDSAKKAIKDNGIKEPMLMLEPGRSITGEAGITLYSIGPIKKINIPQDPGKKFYLSIDGGLSDNPRPVMYDAQYSALIANKASEPLEQTYTVSGKHCETDMMITSIKLPQAQTGDILAVQTTGAYNHAMASNYNRFRRPAVVFVKNGKAQVVYRRETLEDITSNDVLIK